MMLDQIKFEPMPFEQWLSLQDQEFEKVKCGECDGEGEIECECSEEGAPPQRGKRRPPAPGSEALRAIERAGGMEACQGCLLPSARPAPVLASPDGGSLTFSTICCHRLRSQ